MTDPERILKCLASDDEIEGETFSGLTQPKLNLRGKRLSGCSFEGMTLPELQLEGSVLTECRFVRCDLTMAKLTDCSLRDVSFEWTKLMGIDWSAARDLIFDVSFQSCVLSYGVFVKRRLRDVKLLDCVAHEADFSQADLTGADLSGSDLRDARFEGTNLTRADLGSAREYRIRPGENVLKQTRFSMEAALEVIKDLGIVVS